MTEHRRPDSPERTLAKCKGLLAAARDDLQALNRYLERLEAQLEDEQACRGGL
jgi:hypothetical protein